MGTLDRSGSGTKGLVDGWLLVAVGVNLSGRHLVKAAESFGGKPGAFVAIDIVAAARHDWSRRRHVDKVLESTELHA